LGGERGRFRSKGFQIAVGRSRAGEEWSAIPVSSPRHDLRTRTNAELGFTKEQIGSTETIWILQEGTPGATIIVVPKE